MKYKFCHYMREAQPARNIGAYANTFYQVEKQTSFCSCQFDNQNCTNEIAKAHSISKAASLSEIADRGHVITMEDESRLYSPGDGAWKAVVFNQKGINNASTFQAFCSYHDAKLFRELDNLDLTNKELFFWELFYRTVCFERYRKFIASKATPIMRELDSSLGPLEQAHWQDFVTRHELGHSLGFDDLDNFRVSLERAFQSGSYTSEIAYSYFVVSEKLPVAAAGVFQPDLAIDGTRLQVVNRMYRVGDRVSGPSLDHVGMSILPFSNGTILSFCSLRQDKCALDFIRIFSTARSAVDNFVALAVLKMENVFFKPAFVASLSDGAKRSLRALHSFGVGEDLKPNEMRLAMELRLFASRHVDCFHNIDGIAH